MKALDCLKEISRILASFGIESPYKEAEIILAECAEMERTRIYRDNPALPAWTIDKIREFLKRRGRREPLQYIIGHAEFCGMTINVGPGVLIPRPETELLVEEAVKTAGNQRSEVSGQMNILDLCTGSGCIALAIAKQLPESSVYGTDISERALKYAEENARLNDIRNVTFLQGSLFEPVQGMRFDLIVSNPPYIKNSALIYLQPEIKEWEPAEALAGGEDGMKFYRKILQASAGHLTGTGSIIMEAGFCGAEDIINAADASGFDIISMIKDYNGIDRTLKFRPAAVCRPVCLSSGK